MDLADVYAQASADCGKHFQECKKCIWDPSKSGLGLCEIGQMLERRRQRISRMRDRFDATAIQFGFEKFKREKEQRIRDRVAEQLNKVQGARMSMWEAALPDWRIKQILPMGWELLLVTRSSNIIVLAVRPKGKKEGTKVVSVDLSECPYRHHEKIRDWVGAVVDVSILWEIS